MFDMVHFMGRFPEEDIPPTRHAQTHDLECNLDQYVITEEGYLHFAHWDDTSRLAYTGEVNLFFDANEKHWWEYNCEFKDGRMVSMNRAAPPPAWSETEQGA